MVNEIGYVAGVGLVKILGAQSSPSVETPKDNVFFLGNHFVLGRDGHVTPRYFPSRYNTSYKDVVEAVRAHYPEEILPTDSGLFIVAEGNVVEGKTRIIKPFKTLGDFVNYVEGTGREGKTVVSYSRGDFELVSEAIDKSRGPEELWGISERTQNMTYRIHLYGNPPRRAPPKYKIKS